MYPKVISYSRCHGEGDLDIHMLVTSCTLFYLFVGPEQVEQMKMDLLAKVEELGKELPLNTLDMLIDQLGGPDKVAEVC